MEEVIDKIPIIDCHSHLIYSDKLSYPWMNTYPFSLLKKQQEESHYKIDQSSLPIKSLIFMEVGAENSLDETKFIENLSDQNNTIISGIIANYPMKKDKNYLIDYLEKISHNKLVGVRYLLQTTKDNNTYLENDFSEKLQILKRYSLPFHICIYQNQLPNAVKLVERHPDILFFLDHLGKPFEGCENFEFWKDNIKKLSRMDNLYMKLSPGFCYPDNYLNRSEPYIEYIVNNFKNEKMLVGSDYGCGSGNVSFAEWMDLVKKVMLRLKLNQEEVENIFYKNAEKVYNLNNRRTKF